MGRLSRLLPFSGLFPLTTKHPHAGCGHARVGEGRPSPKTALGGTPGSVTGGSRDKQRGGAPLVGNGAQKGLAEGLSTVTRGGPPATVLARTAPHQPNRTLQIGSPRDTPRRAS